MVSSSNDVIETLINSREVVIRINYDNRGWYISNSETEQDMFTFDMPMEILDLYLKSGILMPSSALDLKVQILGEIEFNCNERRQS